MDEAEYEDARAFPDGACICGKPILPVGECEDLCWSKGKYPAIKGTVTGRTPSNMPNSNVPKTRPMNGKQEVMRQIVEAAGYVELPTSGTPTGRIPREPEMIGLDEGKGEDRAAIAVIDTGGDYRMIELRVLASLTPDQSRAFMDMVRDDGIYDIVDDVMTIKPIEPVPEVDLRPLLDLRTRPDHPRSPKQSRNAAGRYGRKGRW